jgi:hypothetical protein
LGERVRTEREKERMRERKTEPGRHTTEVRRGDGTEVRREKARSRVEAGWQIYKQLQRLTKETESQKERRPPKVDRQSE